MPRGEPTSQETVDRVLAAGAVDLTNRAIAQATGLPHTTVTTLLQKHAQGTGFGSSRPIHLMAQWQAVALGALECPHAGLYEGRELSPRDAVSWATVAGIATDKLLILSGRPTSIVASLHEIRPHLPDLVARLVRVAQTTPGMGLEQSRSQGPLTAHPASDQRRSTP